MALTNATQFTRSKGDPQVQSSGHSSLSGADQLARMLGWFSIGLGVTELLAPGYLARTLGLKGKEGLIRAYGAREIMSGLPTLSPDKSFGLASRIAGDVLDLGTLAMALNDDNPKRNNAAVALAMVAGITLLDIAAYSGVKGVHHRSPNSGRDYSGRSGFPQGTQAARGSARQDFEIPPDYHAEGTVSEALSTQK